MKTLLTIIISVTLALGIGSYVLRPQVQQPILGAYNPTGGGTYRLQSSIGGSDSSLTLTSFKEPISNIKYTMSYLNSSIEYATIEPQSTNKEFISFTGITQNADGTATLSGLTRGLGFSFPFTASSTLQQAHSGQSILILSNVPQIYTQQLLMANTVSTSTAILKFSSTTPPRYDFVAAQGTGTFISTTSELASVAYVNAVALTSAPNGTTGIKGVYQSATALQAASSTALGSTGASLVLTSANATDTPQYGCAVGYTGIAGAGCSPIADLTGKIKQAWLNLTDNFVTTGAWTIAASVAKPFTLNGLTYNFPSSQSPNTYLKTDGSGNLSWTGSGMSLLISTTTAGAMSYATTTFTGVDDLHVIIFEPSVGNTSSCLQFNSDAANNYSFVGSSNNSARTGVTAKPVILTEITTTPTTTDALFIADIKNQTAKRKQVIINGSLSDSALDYPWTTLVNGVWNNTSAQITTMVIANGNPNCNTTVPAGTEIRVYGQ